MASQTHRLLKYQERVKAGKNPVIKIAGVPAYYFLGVIFGGTSPLVSLKSIADGHHKAMTASAWKKFGVDL